MTINNYNPQDRVIAFDRTTTRLGSISDTRNRRYMEWVKNGGAATITVVGTAAPTLTGDTGTPVSADGATGAFLQLPTTAVLNDSTRLISSTLAETRRDWQPEFFARILAGANATSIRVWVGLVSANPEDFGTLLGATAHGACFRFDSTVDTTAFWRCVTGNNVADTTTITNVAYTASAEYLLKIVCGDATATTPQVDFYINDVLVASHTATLPTSTQTMGPCFTVTALTGAIKILRFGKMALTSN